MMLRATGLAYLLVLATAVLSTHGATNTTKETPPYYCTTDEDCAAFPDTVCITVESKDTISKCTPNTVARPACRAGQFGLCPSYQDTQRGYLNAHCIFVADDSVAPASATAARRLATNATATSAAGTVKPAETAETTANTTTTTASRAPLTIAPTTDGDGEGSSDVAPADTTTVGDTSGSAVAVASAKFKVGNQTVYGIFKCADLSECDTIAADPTTCRPAKCGSANSITQCNNQGTCTHTSKQDIKMRSCMCYKGYSGSKCEKTVSNACDVDCGVGGNCVDGECVCKAGFDGKKYKNKQGKSDARCTKCTNDLGCENNNACNIELGTCTCEAGFTGPTCGGVEDSCVTKNCGKGNCNVINDKAVCQCPICSPECETCPTKDCSTCPSAASSVTVSVAVLLVAAVTALLMN